MEDNAICGLILVGGVQAVITPIKANSAYGCYNNSLNSTYQSILTDDVLHLLFIIGSRML